MGRQLLSIELDPSKCACLSKVPSDDWLFYVDQKTIRQVGIIPVPRDIPNQQKPPEMSDTILCDTEENECDSIGFEELDLDSYAGEWEDDPDWTKKRSHNTFDFPHLIEAITRFHIG